METYECAYENGVVRFPSPVAITEHGIVKVVRSIIGAGIADHALFGIRPSLAIMAA